MALFPATFASPGDVILVMDPMDGISFANSPYYGMIEEKKLAVIGAGDDLGYEFSVILPAHHDSIKIEPWGWNMSIYNYLVRRGVPSSLLKSREEIMNIRNLSHRRTSIMFQKKLSMLLPSLQVRHANEFSDDGEALSFAANNPGAYFKMPWSSSGRGVICSADMGQEKLRQWIHGAISRQGSVIGEHGYDRCADFASEWRCLNGEVEFLGLSWFNTSRNGNYLENSHLSQKLIAGKIKESSPLWGEYVLEAQRAVIREMIAPLYDGPLGIDMLADKSGNINPCVEINVRMTMGLAEILRNK